MDANKTTQCIDTSFHNEHMLVHNNAKNAGYYFNKILSRMNGRALIRVVW